ncbi:MAG: hypothetical protein IPK35_05960 [Saprospiraceae bacterium]|jgi:hypothetical protein|nr:hypothetical protein [Saprospiraceae bacterium]
MGIITINQGALRDSISSAINPEAIFLVKHNAIDKFGLTVPENNRQSLYLVLISSESPKILDVPFVENSLTLEGLIEFVFFPFVFFKFILDNNSESDREKLFKFSSASLSFGQTQLGLRYNTSYTTVKCEATYSPRTLLGRTGTETGHSIVSKVSMGTPCPPEWDQDILFFYLGFDRTKLHREKRDIPFKVLDNFRHLINIFKK